MKGGWTLTRLAKELGIPSTDVRSLVEARRLPPPRTFTPGPRWPAGTELDNFVPPAASSTRVRQLFDEVCFWYWEQGHSRIPQRGRGRQLAKPKRARPPAGSQQDDDKAPASFPLGFQVSELRAAYRRERLSEVDIDLFERTFPDWSWDPAADDWEQRFRSVIGRWPELTDDDRAWIRLQRRRWESLGEHRQGLLTQQSGLIEAHNPSRVDEFVEAVRDWMDESGASSAAHIPYQATVMIKGFKYPVGRKVTYYRRRYQGLEGRGKNALGDADIASIESIPGWSWAMSRQHVVAAEKTRKHPPKRLPPARYPKEDSNP